MATILINGEKRDVGDGIDLAQLVAALSLPDKRVAVELNGMVIPRSAWPQTPVADGDKLEVVHFVGGG